MCENLKNEIDDITRDLKNLQCIKQNSNLDLKQQIAKAHTKLIKLENDLRNSEIQINNEINIMYNKLNYKSKVLVVKNSVLKLKIEAGEYYKCPKKLTRVFMGNRFCTYYFNAKDAGFYPNKGCEGDRSPSYYEADRRYKPGVTFDNYVAYLITESDDSQIEKLQKLYVMCDNFLESVA